MKVLFIHDDEEAEFLTLVGEKSRWARGLKDSQGLLIHTIQEPLIIDNKILWTSPPLPAWVKPLPDPLHVGRRVRFKWGFDEEHTGTITSHYVDSDDCSGTWGEHKYEITIDPRQKLRGPCSYPVKYCTLLD